MLDINFDPIEIAKIDKKAPAFEMSYYDAEKDTDGTISSEDLKGKWYVLFYYPADFTFVCPTELKDVADIKAILDEMGVEMLPVSTDTIFTHKGWVKAEGLLKGFKYKMLADHNGQYADLYNILDLDNHLAGRGTFIVDPDGILRGLDITSGAQGRNSAELIRKLQGLQFMRENPTMACPARWAPGSVTLTPGIDLVGKVAEAM
jgi:peroxiredoxin (alkyl hydroperoxide reductase subunit C)